MRVGCRRQGAWPPSGLTPPAPHRSVNIPSSPGGRDTSQGQETASMTDTCLTLLPPFHAADPHPQTSDSSVGIDTWEN